MTRAPNLEKLEKGPPPFEILYKKGLFTLFTKYVQTLQVYSTGPPLCSPRACQQVTFSDTLQELITIGGHVTTKGRTLSIHGYWNTSFWCLDALPGIIQLWSCGFGK